MSATKVWRAGASTADTQPSSAANTAAMPLADEQVLSLVPLSPEGDTYYPDFDRAEWTETKREPRDGFEFVWLERTRG